MSENMSPTKMVSDIGKYGIAKNNRYNVMLDLPLGVNSLTSFLILGSTGLVDVIKSYTDSDLRRSLSMRCNTMTMPGRTIQTAMGPKGTGVPKHVPTGIDYATVDFSFISSNELKERLFFEAWQGMVMNVQSSTLNFYDEYQSDVTLQHLSSDGEVTYQVILKEAYPVSVNSVEYGYDKTNELHITTVSMMYRYWTNSKL